MDLQPGRLKIESFFFLEAFFCVNNIQTKYVYKPKLSKNTVGDGRNGEIDIEVMEKILSLTLQR